jgi:hypothetical protein
MKLRVFHASDGDCHLLSTDDERHHMLVDGGRKGTFKDNVRQHLATLREEGTGLDIVCVSHIDNDHISGIVQLLEDEVEWRKFEFRKASDPDARSPSVPRPPQIGQVWHNALFWLVGEDLAPQVESALGTSAALLAGSDDRGVQNLASQYENLATGEKSSMELSRRISDEQLGIALNPFASGDLMKRGTPGETIQLGGMDLFVLGPSDDDLEALRLDWKKWVDEEEETLTDLHRKMLFDEQELGALSPELVANPIAAGLGEGLSSITPPNLASLMLLAEEGDETILLTGDGESVEILQGLEHHGKLDADGTIHVTVLKVQHHGALANVTQEFVDRVAADHYVFCGNGAHSNPEMEVVEAFARVRLENPGRAFKFWFTSSSATPGLSEGRRAHMEAIEALVDRLITESSGLMTAAFLPQGHFSVL